MATADILDNVERVQTAEILAEDVDDRRLVAARSQENLVGMGVGVLRHGTLYAWGFYVDPALHRTGIGRRIMAALCADLADDAMVEVQVYTESHDAIAFYTALGFTTAGRIETELFPGHMCTLSIMAAKRSTLEI
ncbi:hypothetical protein RA29_14765 [Tateyamaria sp. ANG-S1]|nr:hypothetical protein RA29_14765 [Tateyamaria sp. ANG-S1]